jgi:hypothetical protein
MLPNCYEIIRWSLDIKKMEVRIEAIITRTWMPLRR